MNLKARVKEVESRRLANNGYLAVCVEVGETKEHALDRTTNGEGAKGRRVVYIVNCFPKDRP